MSNEIDDTPQVIVCAGPPLCDLEGDEAIAQAESGCPMCKRILLHEDGTETEFKAKPN